MDGLKSLSKLLRSKQAKLIWTGYSSATRTGLRLQKQHRLAQFVVNHVRSFHQDHTRFQELAHSQLPENAQQLSDFVIRSPYPDLTIPDDISLPHLIMNSLPKYGNSTALVDVASGQEMTYSELHTSVAKVASGLVKLGLRKDDVVTIFSPNSSQFVIATIAVSATGAIFSPINPLYTAGELKNALTHVRSKFLITIPAFASVAKAVVKECPHVQEVIVFGEAEGCRPFSSLLQDDMSHFPENVDFRPMTELGVLPFSSGTTGLPKPVMLSHYNLVANILQNREKIAMGYEAGVDCLLGLLPFFHIYAQTMVMFTGLFCGTKLVILDKFQPDYFLDTIQKHRPTYVHIVPPLMLFMAKHPLVSQYDLSSVRNVFVGAAPTPSETVFELLERFNKQQLSFRQGYGLTEASPLTHCNPPSGIIKYHSAGPAVNNTRFKIVDLETRELLGPGKSGELCILGPQVMLGYYKNESSTSETIVDGWLHTGDVAYYDEDRHIILCDRIKEMIKVKGLQVAPAELESILVTHPSVAEAAVIGLKDERLGEAPKAFVVLKPQAKASAEELSQYVAEKVAPYKKLVGGIEFRSEIPKSASGKILRRFLREEANSK